LGWRRNGAGAAERRLYHPAYTFPSADAKGRHGAYDHHDSTKDFAAAVVFLGEDEKQSHFMKSFTCLMLSLALNAGAPAAFSQSSAKSGVQAAPVQEAELTRFDLEFPGGTPGELVAAIQRASGRRLNAIIPDAYVSYRLPPLKMAGVDVAQLFRALYLSSHTREILARGNSLTHVQSQSGFRTDGPISDDSVWYFFVDGHAGRAPEVSRFYLLTPYLAQGLTVDDITTAIQTGWKMLGESPPPKISFHQETKLLIAVGEAHRLETIDAVLKALASSTRPTATSAKPVSDGPDGRSSNK
jgi:hypothetical protein